MRILAAFSARASRADHVRFLFDVYDMDGDGVVSREDLELVLRQLAGTSLRYLFPAGVAACGGAHVLGLRNT